MRFKQFILSVCVIIVLSVFAVGQAFAGGGGMEGLPPGASLEGSGIWAAIVLTCVNSQGKSVIDMVSLRAKKIEDCNVETQAVLGKMDDLSSADPWDCPLSADDIVNNYIPLMPLFNDINPVFTKVKNFVNAPDGTISFDAQIKFLQ